TRTAVLTMLRRGGATGRLDAHVVELERENGQSVDDHARRLGVERAVDPQGPEPLQEPVVEPLDGVVAPLVAAIDHPLRLTHPFRAQVVPARYVLLVPEIKIHAMILLNGRPRHPRSGPGRGLVPARCPAGLFSHDRFGVQCLWSHRYLNAEA